jgi:GNAT superfamily N-acetyltransferase
MDEIIIRHIIKPGDIGSIIKLHGEYYYKNYELNASFEPYVAIPLAECIQRNLNNERIWVVEKDKEVKGSIAITKYNTTTAQLRWYLLDEAVQGKGIGGKLIKEAIAFSKEKKYKNILLWTFSELTKAILLYKENGFTLVEETGHFKWGKAIKEQCYELKLGKEI